MTREQLFENISRKKSYLCIGLDPDLEKLPRHLLSQPDPVLAFCREIIVATADLCVAYKPNLAFFEALGPKGWLTLQQVLAHIPKDQFVIADAKRGDIGNTATLYAKAFFRELGCDAITVAPYMGRDSVEPFLQFPGKWAVVLALTSNPGSQDFQRQPLLGRQSGIVTEAQPKPYGHDDPETSLELWEWVLQQSGKWGTADNTMYVVGATRAEALQRVRELVPEHFLLVPGVGAQGGSLEEVSRNGLNGQCGLLVNASRSVLYASSGEDFAEAARKEAQAMQREMAQFV